MFLRKLFIWAILCHFLIPSTVIASSNQNQKQEKPVLEQRNYPNFQGQHISTENYHALLQQTFKNYQLFYIPTNKLHRYLQNTTKDGLANIRLTLGNNYAWTMQLQQNELRSATYKAKSLAKKGIVDLAMQPCIYYKGHLQNGASVRLSIDEGFMYGSLSSTSKNGDAINNQTYIEPLRNFVADAPADYFIVYQATDVQVDNNPKHQCLHHQVQQKKAAINPNTTKNGASNTQATTAPLTSNISQRIANPNLPNSPASPAFLEEPECWELIEFAIASDYSLFQEKGSFENVVKYQLSILNVVQAFYEPLYLNVQVSEHVISDCSTCDYWGDSSDPYVLLPDFIAWANDDNADNFDNPHDVGQLWTNKSLSSVIGLADIGTMCSDNKYSLIEDYTNKFSSMTVLSAHELGHSLGADHDLSSYLQIMYPSITSLAMGFGDVSINAINTHIASIDCLTDCPRCPAVTEANYSNYTGTSVSLSWNGQTIRYHITVLELITKQEFLSADVLGQTFNLSNLSPCYGYEVWVEPICNDGSYGPGSIIKIEEVMIDNIVINPLSENDINISWDWVTYPINFEVIHDASNSAVVSTTLTGTNNYTITGLSPCSSYTVNIETDCGNGITGIPSTINFDAVNAYSIYPNLISPNQAEIVFFSDNLNYEFNLKVREQGTTNWLFEEPAAVPNTGGLADAYIVDGLNPCTTYEIELYPICAGGTYGMAQTSTFQTSSIEVKYAVPKNCNPNTATYDLELIVEYNTLSNVSTGFNVNVDGIDYTIDYTASPQVVVIPDIPSSGFYTVDVEVSDLVYPSCNSETSYESLRPTCNCTNIMSESFDACTLPEGWAVSTIGGNPNATWQWGTTSDGHSLNETCMLYFDDDDFDGDGGEVLQITSPTINLMNYEEVTISFDYNFNTIKGEFSLEIWDGIGWQKKSLYNSSNCGFWGCDYPQAQLDLTNYIGPDFQFRFAYDDGGMWDWYIGIDNIELCGFNGLNECAPNVVYPSNLFCTSETQVPSPIIVGNPGGTFSTSSTGLDIDAVTGKINPANSMEGMYNVAYTLPAYPDCVQEQIITITNNCNAYLSLNVLLEGPFSANTGTMSTTLNDEELFPLAQNYHTPPWNYLGNEKIIVRDVIPPTTIDWVLIELYQPNTDDDNITLVARKAALLLANGTVVDADDPRSNLVHFKGVAAGDYYVMIRHRNHLDVMSATPVSLPNSNTPYDFSVIDSMAYGAGQQTLLPYGTYAMYAGDINADGVITYMDANMYQNQLNITNGYVAGDANLDGEVTNNDFEVMQPNIQVIGIHQIRY